MYDSTPAHFTRSVRDVLNNDKRIGTAEPFAWSPRSPDLRRLDFYLWGHIKTLLYSDPVENEKILNTLILVPVKPLATAPGHLKG